MPEHEDSKLEFHSRSTSGQHCVPIDYIQRAPPRSAIQWKVAESPTAHAALSHFLRPLRLMLMICVFDCSSRRHDRLPRS